MGEDERFPVMVNAYAVGGATVARVFPQCPTSIPYALVLAHEVQAYRNHSQDVAALKRRGGLDPIELWGVLHDRSYPWDGQVTMQQAVDFLCSLSKEADMEMIPVESSNLAAVGYDPDTKILTLRFRDGGVYDYADVPPERHAEFMASASKGKYFHAHIKPHYKALKRPAGQATPGMPWKEIAASAYRAYKASFTASFDAARPGMPWKTFEDLTDAERVAWEAAVRQVGTCIDYGHSDDEERWAGWRPPA